MFESRDISKRSPRGSTRAVSRTDPEFRRLAARLRHAIRAEQCSRARTIALIGEFDKAGAYVAFACETTAEWVAMHCGIARATAREYVRVARALRSLPKVHEGFIQGELTYSRVRAVTRFATDETDAELAATARRTRVEGLEEMARLRRQTRAKTDPSFPMRARSCRRIRQDGMPTYIIKLPADWGSILDAALDQVAGQMGVSAETDADESELHPDGAPAWERRRADAVVEMARMMLSGRQGAQTLSPPTQVNLHLDASSGEARIDNGPIIGPKTLERLLCDAAMRRVMHLPGRKVDYGRTSRTVSEAQRRAILAAYEHCQWPGCRTRRFLDVHHVRHWTRGGPTDASNLLPFCARHHSAGHDGGYEISLDENEMVTVLTPSGEVLVGPITKRLALPTGRGTSVGEPAAPYGESASARQDGSKDPRSKSRPRGSHGRRPTRRKRESAFGAAPG